MVDAGQDRRYVLSGDAVEVQVHLARRVAPGATLAAGYDFTLPGNHNTLTMTVSAAKVTFPVACVSAAAPSQPTLTVNLKDQAYTITNDQWYPSGDQSSPLVYQGSVTVPDLCGGGTISLAKGGTFTATLGANPFAQSQSECEAQGGTFSTDPSTDQFGFGARFIWSCNNTPSSVVVPMNTDCVADGGVLTLTLIAPFYSSCARTA